MCVCVCWKGGGAHLGNNILSVSTFCFHYIWQSVCRCCVWSRIYIIYKKSSRGGKTFNLFRFRSGSSSICVHARLLKLLLNISSFTLFFFSWGPRENIIFGWIWNCVVILCVLFCEMAHSNRFQEMSISSKTKKLEHLRCFLLIQQFLKIMKNDISIELFSSIIIGK